jgi:hypothetical protein
VGSARGQRAGAASQRSSIRSAWAGRLDGDELRAIDAALVLVLGLR